MFADFFERAGFAAVEAEAELEDLAFALVEWTEEAVDLVGEQRSGGDFEGRFGAAVFDDVAEFSIAVFAKRLAERERFGREAQCFGDLFFGHLDFGRELDERCGAAELELQASTCLLQAGERVAGVHGEADGATGVGDAAGDRLTNPPGGVGGELEALAPVELFDGVHETEVALLDEVKQRQARGLVLLGDRNHEAEVRLDEGAFGVVAGANGAANFALACSSNRFFGFEFGTCFDALLDELREANFVVLRQQRVLTNVRQVETNKVLFVPFCTLFRHKHLPSLFSPAPPRLRWHTIPTPADGPTLTQLQSCSDQKNFSIPALRGGTSLILLRLHRCIGANGVRAKWLLASAEPARDDPFQGGVVGTKQPVNNAGLRRRRKRHVVD